MLIFMWCAGIALKAVAAYHIARERLAREYLAIFVYLSWLAVHASILLALRGKQQPFLQFYSLDVPLILFLKFWAVSAVFRALTINYRDFRAVGTAILGMLTALGVLAAWITSLAPLHPIPAPWLWRAALFAQRYASEMIIVVMLGVRYLLVTLRSPKVRIPRTAQRAATLIAFDCILTLAGSAFVRSYAYSYPKASAFIPTVLGAAIAAGWLLMRRLSDAEVAVMTPGEREDYRSKKRERLHLLRAEIEYALRKAQDR